MLATWMLSPGKSFQLNCVYVTCSLYHIQSKCILVNKIEFGCFLFTFFVNASKSSQISSEDEPPFDGHPEYCTSKHVASHMFCLIRLAVGISDIEASCSCSCSLKARVYRYNTIWTSFKCYTILNSTIPQINRAGVQRAVKQIL